MQTVGESRLHEHVEMYNTVTYSKEKVNFPVSGTWPGVFSKLLII